MIKLTKDSLEESEKKLTTLSQLPWYFMKHIIGLDSNVRENCHIASSDGQSNRPLDTEEKEHGQDEDSDTEIQFSDEDDENGSTDMEKESTEYKIKDFEPTIHPLDLIYAIFLCADDFLRQELMEKMSKCQYAVPFILPPANRIRDDSKPLILQWGLRSMRRSYHYHNTVENKSLANVECPFVSFMSIGEETSWKSKLLNKMLSPQ